MGSQEQVQGDSALRACYSWAITWSQTHVSLPNGALAADMAATGLELVRGPGAVSFPQPLATWEGGAHNHRFPSHGDVIPRGLALTVGNLAQPEPSAPGHGIAASTPCGREAVSVLTAPGPSS